MIAHVLQQVVAQLGDEDGSQAGTATLLNVTAQVRTKLYLVDIFRALPMHARELNISL